MPSDYPHEPGWKARETSHAAAVAVAPMARSLRARVYDCIQERPDTPEGVARRLNLDILAVRPRCTELARLGKIHDSGARGRSRSGKSAIIWTTEQQG